MMKGKIQSTIGRIFKTYVADALSFMAMGLFCSLILGLIIKQLALIPGLDFLMDIAQVLQSAPVVGGSIGLAIALGFKRTPLVTISAVAVGALGYQFGGPIGAYLASIAGVEAGSLVSKRTPVDIIVTPLVAVVAGGLFAKYCCAQMIGFAVISYKDNGLGGLISQGLGTSIQIGNIARKPIIWLAPTLTSAILGPVSTTWLKMTNNAAGAGMGTAGLAGPLGCWDTMAAFIAPAVLSLFFHFVMKRLGWVKDGDMKLHGQEQLMPVAIMLLMSYIYAHNEHKVHILECR